MSSEFPAADMAHWRARVEKELKGRDFEKSLVIPNEEGIPLQPVYDSSNSAAAAAEAPGTFPFVRGSKSEAGFLRIQEYDESDGEQLYRLIDEDMEAGLDGIRIRLDRRLRLGIDPKDETESTTDGALLYEMGALAEVLKPIFESGAAGQKLIVSLDAGGNALPMAACALALRELESSSSDSIAFHFNADPSSALVRDGFLPRSLTKMQSEALSLALKLAKSGKDDRAITIDGDIWQEAGASAARELGLMMASLASWLRAAAKSKVDPKILAGQIVLRTGMERDIFQGIAKIRALRKLWSSLLSHFGVTDVAPMIWGTTATRTLSQIDPWVNILRASTQGLAAITGGADIVSVRPFDLLADAQDDDPESLDDWNEPGNDEDSLFRAAHELRRDSSTRLGRRLARNTLLILDEEAGLGAVQDPAGGSFYLEELSEQLSQKAYAVFQEIEAKGGFNLYLSEGEFSTDLSQDQEGRERNLASRKIAMTAVSEFPVIEDNFEPEFDHNRQREYKLLRERLSQHKAARGYIGGLNPKLSLVDGMVDAAARGATIDELSDQLADSGLAARVTPPICTRDSWSFETLRAASAFAGRPVVYLATLGSLVDHLPRLGFAQNLYNIAALTIALPGSPLPHDPSEAAEVIIKEAAAAKAQAICLVGSDAAYDDKAAALIQELHDAFDKDLEIHLAGRLKPERQRELESLGLKKTIHLGCDVISVLTPLTTKLSSLLDLNNEDMSQDDLGDLCDLL